ncbi:ATP-dependent RNA helicase [Corynebacterium sp. CNCTC7651]|uniref:ATP-dependent RNA helicase n=1 Tax=Corynebacterium sp. CNCTC7651 TaxID=2815361 RepID=UPI001F36EEDC|nr:ATP-dependent helicase C-terminal domain-containing protein [Corynebacterium sp. CNCTC7651]UIZ92204.1 ATP-dependent RNA helicase [Corynebacterium sp. CNCTC7651]
MFNLERIGAGLPVANVIDQLPPTGPLVVEAPPGTGKTTLIPPAVSNLTAAQGKTLVTAPRRVAVRAAARRLSLLDASPLGERVGYAIRGEHKPGELVEFVTPGVLLNRLLKDPGLEGVGAVIIDEVHERQLDTDLVLAMCMEVAVLRDDFYLAAMSATLDASAFADHMGAQILSTEAVTHPLDIEYVPLAGRIEGGRGFYGSVAKHVPETERTLVFVPGAREVEWVCEALGSRAVPLHGRLTSAEQDAALGGDAPVVVATSIAESSITVPGVRTVVDAGLARVPRRDARGMTGLVTVSESKASANQRAGRAARLGPGRVIRLYSQADYQHFPAETAPEIATSDLTGAVLAMRAWGSPDLPLMDQPPAAALAQAEEALAAIGAVDADGALTDLGRKLAALPVDPRLGAALLTLGSGAAPTVAAIADGASGDLARANPPKRQVERLARLAPKGPPVPAGDVVAAAFPQWVAKRVGSEYLLASGTRATLGVDMGTPEWLAAAEVQRTRSGAVIRAAAATELPKERVREDIRASLIDGTVRGRNVTAVGAIELTSTPVKLTPEQAMGALSGVTFTDFVLDEEAQRLKNRIDFLRETLGDPWPDVTAGEYSQEIAQLAAGTPLTKLDMRAALMRQLTWPEAGQLAELAPERLEVPSGSHPRVDYATGRPVVRVKLQECFGLAASPELTGVKVLFHLLSPVGRELAVTDDLASFWDGPYQDVRKEMRGRYPKHPWPEDPWTAQATARTKRNQHPR